MAKVKVFFIFVLISVLSCVSFGSQKIKVLIIDGVNNHDWKSTTIAAKATLEQTGRFTVDICTSPSRNAPKGEWKTWRPKFFAYDVIVSDFNDDCEVEGGCEPIWSPETRADFEKFVREGGGLVTIHAADNAFATWPEYNEMIGGGGWGGRKAGMSGSLLRMIDGKWTTTSPSKGLSGEHGDMREFLVIHDKPSHPILKGLPTKWKHATDELYSALRGPYKNVEVLAHSYSLYTKENEPTLMIITYGKGKVFHIPLGHYNDEYPPFGEAVHCVGYQTVLARGTEYVATGKVTIGIPDFFPGKENAVVIAPEKLEWPKLYENLITLFKEFRKFQRPETREDTPDYSAPAMEKKYRELKIFQNRLAAIDSSSWPVSEQIDYHLVRAEMNGLEFQLRVLKPWSRNPGFYSGRRGGLGRLPRLPLEGGRLAKFRSRLQAIPKYYEQAKKNLGSGNISEIPGDLAILAIHYLEGNDDYLTDFVTQLADHHPNLVPVAKKAQAAMDGYLNWLKENKKKMTASAGVGIKNYNWLLKNVYLFPYTWEECRRIVEHEDNRVITFLRLEENKNRNIPPLKPVTSQDAYRRSVQDALQHVMKFIRDEEIFTVQHYLVIDDYLKERLQATSRPWPEKHDYFYNFSHREPVMEETHEMVGHHFDLLTVLRDDRPIRGNREHEGPYDIACARLEGWAFALEELLMHAGYLDDRSPHGREITYEQAAFRTVRALSDLYMHKGDWSLTDAMEYCVANAPHGELLDDSPHLWGEMQTTLLHVGWHMQMVVGKVHFMKLFRDRSQQLGDNFNLKKFMDEFLEAGVIPVSLIRWEMTGYDDEIKELWK